MLRRTWCRLALGLAIAGMVGCGSKPAAMFHDPTFTPQAMSDGKMIVLGGVAVERVNQSDFLSGGFATRLLEEQTRARRSDLRIVRNEAAAENVEFSTYTDALQQYRLRGNLRPAELTNLQPISKAARYGVLCRIDMNDVETKRDDLSEIEDSAIRSITQIDAIRRVGAVFDVYDLEAETLVWTAYFHIKRDHVRRIDRGERDLDDPNAPGWNSGTDDAPDVPELSDLLSDLFRNFANALPKK